MIRKKSKEGDEQLIRDESANAAERASAIFRLAVDGYKEMEPYLVKLLDHKEYSLRKQAIKVLLGGWGKEKYMKKAFEMLHNDSDFSVRGTTAFSLSEFVNRFLEARSYKKQVLKELVKQLQDDDDSFVQRQCYQSALEIIENTRVGVRVPEDFDLKRDVNWSLLEPYVQNSQ